MRGWKKAILQGKKGAGNEDREEGKHWDRAVTESPRSTSTLAVGFFHGFLHSVSGDLLSVTPQRDSRHRGFKCL